MANASVGSGTKPSASGGAQNSPRGGIDWQQRAGPIFKYGLATGFTLILFGGMSLHLSLTNPFLGHCQLKAN